MVSYEELVSFPQTCGLTCCFSRPGKLMELQREGGPRSSGDHGSSAPLSRLCGGPVSEDSSLDAFQGTDASYLFSLSKL